MAGYTRQSTFADGDTITAALFNNEYNQLVNAFSNTTGHSHDGTAASGPVIGLIGDAGETSPNNKVLIDTTNNYIEFYVEVSSAPVQQLYIADGAIIPVTDSDIDLGTTSLRFKDTYTDTITTTGNVDVGGNLTVTGTTTFNGGTITMGDAATDNVVFGADVDSNIIPDDDDSYDLGSSSQEWRNLYIDGTAHIDTLDVDINATIAGTLGVTGVLTGTSLDISGDIDVDGTTNLDVVDIDGAVDMATTLAVAGNVDFNGDLDVDGTTNLDVVDIDGAVDMATTLAVAGNVDFNGDLDVDGTTNLDVVDIDGAVDMATTLTVGGEITAASLDISGNVDIDGTLETDALSINSTAVTSTAAELNILDGVTSTAAELNILDGVTSTATELNLLDGVTSTTAELNILDGVTASAADINLIDGITNGTVIASKAIITDANKDITGGRNITISGELDAATLDISGDADIDGTLEADAITIGGITLAETISDTVGAMVSSNTETNITVSYDDSDNTLDFVIGTLNQDTTGLAATATALATARTIHGVSFDGTANIDLTEVVQDTVGAMFTSNTESGITVAYQDADGTVDFTVGTLNQDTTGLAATATALATARTIGGVSFDGTANITPTTFAAATFSGDLNVDSGVLFADVSTNRVGINQTSPDVSLDVGSNTDAIHVPSGTTAERPTSPAAGYFRYNSTTGDFEGYTDAWGAIAGGGGGTAPTIDTMTGDGSDTTLTLTSAPVNENATVVTIDGVVQHKDTYSVSSNTLTFSEAPPTGTKVECITWTNTAVNSALLMQDADGDTQIQVEESSDEDKIRFDTGGTERMIIDSTGVGIGTSSPSGGAVGGKVLHLVNSGGTASVRVDRSDSTTAGTISLLDANSTHGLYGTGSKPMAFSTNSTERMRIDSSGNLLVGTTDSATYNFTSGGGTAIWSNGLISAAKSGAIVGIFNRTSSDGDILQFRKDGSAVGSIGASGGDLTVGTGDTGIRFVDASDSIQPINTSTGGRRDAAVDIGVSSYRFKDLYLSSKVNLGDTYRGLTYRSANNDILLEAASGLFYRQDIGNTNHSWFTGNSERMRIDSSGNLLVGATSAILSASNRGNVTINGASDSILNLGVGGNQAGYLYHNGTALNLINTKNGELKFFTNDLEKMRIDSSGNLLVGTTNTNPAENNVTGASILGGGDGRLLLCVDGNEVAQFNRKTTDGTILVFRQNAVARGSVSISGANTSYNTTSDARLKDVTGEARGLEVINKLNPVAYNWKEDGKADEGLIAQEVLDIVPNAVSGSEEDMYQMDYSKLVVHLVAGMKEQQTQIDALQSEINNLKGE